jgi:hypothetical protein
MRPEEQAFKFRSNADDEIGRHIPLELAHSSSEDDVNLIAVGA